MWQILKSINKCRKSIITFKLSPTRSLILYYSLTLVDGTTISDITYLRPISCFVGELNASLLLNNLYIRAYIT